MSTGIVVCSICNREVHQDGPREPGAYNGTWRHCEDKTPRCEGAWSQYPLDVSHIKGKWCGRDG